jgi:sugar lactone lactonase YvrE
MRANTLRASLAIVAIAVVPLVAHPGSGIVVDRQGQVFFIDTGAGVWKIDTQGRLTKQDGTMFHWMALDAGGGLGSSRLPTSPAGEFSRISINPTLIVASDFPVAVARDGVLFYPERRPDGRVELRRWTSSGVSSVLATLPARTESGLLRDLNGLAAGADGTVYYSENAAVRRVASGGDISTVAARVVVPNCEAIPGIEPATTPYLRGLDVAEDRTVYVAAAGCGAVLRISPRGEVAVVLRATSPWSPTGVALAGRDVYVLEYVHTVVESRRDWTPRVRRLRPDGTVTIVASISRQ